MTIAMAPVPPSDPTLAPVPTVRRPQDIGTVLENLGALRDLPGMWIGTGFNLIARPDFAARTSPPSPGEAHLFLELNSTVETLKFDTISSPIPNRGFDQPDIELYGLHYLQQISDAVTGGALHIEPGIWINVPQTTDPAVTPSVTRMASIPHGTTMLASGTAFTVPGPPVIAPANTVPFGVGSPVPAPGSANGFPEYNLATVPAPVTRTPAVDIPDVTQAIVDDPTSVLRAAIAGQTILQTTVLDVATVASVDVGIGPSPAPPAVPPSKPQPVPDGGGGTDNIAFLQTNATAATVFATFWIEQVQDPYFTDRCFMQLQYVQTVFLNFPVDTPGGPVNLTWPHVSVATLQKGF